MRENLKLFFLFSFSTFKDLNSWMLVYGYNTKDMLGSAYMQDMIQKPTAQINSPQLAPDFGLMSGLQCIVDKVSVTDQF